MVANRHLVQQWGRARLALIIPAGVGNSQRGCFSGWYATVHPRVRGEHTLDFF
jgi:hypothetical protein